MTEVGQRPVVGDYILLSTLGRGATGKVKLAEHKETGKKVAIKIIGKKAVEKDPEFGTKLRREISLMKLFNNPHLLRLVDVLESAAHLYIILEYAEHGELFDYLTSQGTLTVDEAMRIFRQIIYGLEFLHNHAICHRDLKLENILLDSNDTVKIADFGLARYMKEDIAETSCGSPHYASPEVILGAPYDGRKSDIWSAGVVLYVLLSGNLPFDDPSIRVLLSKVTKGAYRMPPFPPDICDLVRRMMQVDPAKRITLAEIKQHEAFRRGLPSYYICPSPLPIPVLNNPIDPGSLTSDIVDVLEQLGFQDEKERNEQLMSKEHTMVKAFVFLLTNKDVFEYLPWNSDLEAIEDPMANLELTFEGENPMFGAFGAASLAGSDPFYRRAVGNAQSLSMNSPQYSVIESSLLSGAEALPLCEECEEIEVANIPIEPLMGSVLLAMKRAGFSCFFPDEYKIIARKIDANFDVLIEAVLAGDGIVNVVVSSPKASFEFKGLVERLRAAIDDIFI